MSARYLKRKTKKPPQYEIQEIPLDDDSDNMDNLSVDTETDHSVVEEKMVLDSDDLTSKSIPLGRKRKRIKSKSSRGSKKKSNQSENDQSDDDEDTSDNDEKRRKKRELTPEEKRELLKKAEKMRAKMENQRIREFNKRRKECEQKVKALQEDTRRNLINLIHVGSQKGVRVYDQAMTWEITTDEGGCQRFRGLTNVLADVVFPDNTDDVDDDMITGNDIIGQTEHGALQMTNKDIVTEGDDILNGIDDLQLQNKRSVFKCKHYGQIHGKIVHDELSRAIQYWIQNGTIDSGDIIQTMDPCVGKIITLLLETGFVPVWTEYPIYDETSRIATSIDLICTTPKMTLAILEIKTSSSANGLYNFLTGGDTQRTMKGKFSSIKDTGVHRAAFQLLATEAILRKHYPSWRPSTYQIVFVCSDMKRAEMPPLPVWFWEGCGDQIGMNRCILNKEIYQHSISEQREKVVQATQSPILKTNTRVKKKRSNLTSSSNVDRSKKGKTSRKKLIIGQHVKLKG